MNLCPPGCLCLVHPLCIVWWKPGCPCMAVCLCPSHLISVATPCLECVHASVHEFMSTLHPMSGPPPMDSYMESWVPLCVTLSVFQSPWLWSHTLFTMCTCISTWIYVHLAAYVWSTPICIVWWKPGCPCMAVCLCPSHLISVATPCLECVHASVHEFMSTLHPMSGPPPMDSYMESWVPLCVNACVSQSPYFCSYTLFRMCTCISTWIYVHLAVYVWSTPMHSLMETRVPLYGSVFVSQSSHFCCHTFLDCVHASVQEFTSTWLPSSGPALCILWCQVGCPCMAVCLCPSHIISDPTPCLDCVHVSVHKFMSTFLSMSGPHPLHTLMSSWVPLYGSVFVSQSQHFWSHTLFRMCTCIRTYIYVHLTPHVSSTTYG